MTVQSILIEYFPKIRKGLGLGLSLSLVFLFHLMLLISISAIWGAFVSLVFFPIYLVILNDRAKFQITLTEIRIYSWLDLLLQKEASKKVPWENVYKLEVPSKSTKGAYQAEGVALSQIYTTARLFINNEKSYTILLGAKDDLKYIQQQIQERLRTKYPNMCIVLSNTQVNDKK